MTDTGARVTPWLIAALLFAPLGAHAFQAAAPTPKPATTVASPPVTAGVAAQPPVILSDPILRAAEDLVGRALILRGFPASNNLEYDASGALLGKADLTDWTLAGVNVLKATRQGQERIELEGVRVAIRYNSDAHEFQRHPLNDEKMKLLIRLGPGSDSDRVADGAGGPDPNQANAKRNLLACFAAIFSIGIDPALQRSMPPLWRHYFDPSVAWPADALTSATIYPIAPLPPLHGPPTEIVPPILSHQTSSQFTPSARHDRVTGTVQLRLVVDADGVPQRITVTHPLGYGLDQQAAEAAAKWRFNPALHAGQPVAAAILVNIDYVPPPPQR